MQRDQDLDVRLTAHGLSKYVWWRGEFVLVFFVERPGFRRSGAVDAATDSHHRRARAWEL